jgi:hypothetical protein
MTGQEKHFITEFLPKLFFRKGLQFEFEPAQRLGKFDLSVSHPIQCRTVGVLLYAGSRASIGSAFKLYRPSGAP